ncbi:phenylalanine--tRNA ligase alpha subunit-like [Branchiostoma lanceolatum]|uniref:phenylalanine--tRNA ligase alpha subunit-like n=1 Tax=Branchiostoma lanceolatum TaxID=7740 RepID=UPI0034564299
MAGDGVDATILQLLQDNDGLDTKDIARQLGKDHQLVVGAVKSLQSLGDVITAEQCVSKWWELTGEGQLVVENGSHEAVLYRAIPPEGVLQKKLMESIPNAKVGFSNAMKKKWIHMDKTGANGPVVKQAVSAIEDDVQKTVQDIAANQGEGVDNKVKQEMKKRKLIQEVTMNSFVLKKGSGFSTSVTKLDTDLTPEMINSGLWKEKKFKPYNFDALGVPPVSGHLHPLLKVRAQFRQIFLEMGFTEMKTNNYIESSFWNFDTLFVPQQHPARDEHDTFFIKEPMYAQGFPEEYMDRVKTVHSQGGFGSQGYQYEWKREEAQKNVLRTHTTAVSARMLYQLAQQQKDGFKPVKLFSIDRVFRNETLDATHLAEFNQIEGVVADYNLTLGDLMGVLHAFFKKLGIEKLRFKPAYNPYTEPSMEVFSYHEGLQKWVEVGNSGVFRPEMLLPMGLPEDISVIAWGLSLERPTMIKYGIDNIRELVGHKINLQMVYDNPICQLTS